MHRTYQVPQRGTTPQTPARWSKEIRTPLPDGRYGVADPDQPDKLTFWVVRGSKLTPWPNGVRYAPLPPRWIRDPVERQDWYDTSYFPWRDRVVDAIASDPTGATELFDWQAPGGPVPHDFGAPKRRGPRPRPWPSRRRVSIKQRRRGERQVIAVVLHQAGRSYAEIAGALDVPKTTAFRLVNTPAAGSRLSAAALVLARAEQVLTHLGMVLVTAEPVDKELIEQWVTDLQVAAGTLRREVRR
jgi:hypothetical protein